MPDTTARPRKKLIEVAIPLEAINKASAREKSIRHGHPSTLHLWWARRPLAACRAVLFAQLVDDPSSWPERFDHDEAKIEAERRRLHKVIEDLVPWEASNDERILNAARWEIARSIAWGMGEEPPPQSDGKAILDYLQAKAPPVYDPFSGGGSIPLEAQRLGLRAYGSDLNPVAVLIGKALVEIPPKFAGMPPINPKAQAESKRGGRWNSKGAQGLAEDVRYYGQWMRDEAERRIGHIYPKVTLPDGSEATVIAWLWARTVRSPDPAANGAMVPLVSSFMLSTKEGRKSWIEPVIDSAAPNGWRFEVRTGALSKADEERLKKGTKTGRGEFACLLTGCAIDDDYIRRSATTVGLGARLLAVVAESHRSRHFVAADTVQEKLAQSVVPEDAPDEELFSRALGFRIPGYGFTTWSNLFTSRQILAVQTFSSALTMVADKLRTECDNEKYVEAVVTYLALSISRSTSMWSSNCWWQANGEFVAQVFTRQALSMIWDFAEVNPFSNSTGNFLGAVDWIVRCLQDVVCDSPGSICQLPAQMADFSGRIISSDPPYFDNVGYADLSDFYYVWLKRMPLGSHSAMFRRIVTPKDEELVATPGRHGGVKQAAKFFLKGMENVMQRVARSLNEEPLTLFYAFKQSEEGDDGVTSTGWSVFLQSIVSSGLSIDGTWPLRTERPGGVRNNLRNSLASSIVLVCRKRNPVAPVATRAEFIRALKRELPDAIAKIRSAGVGPVDMQQSVIGPGMGVFTRYAEVLEDDDSIMTVRTALSLINRVWEEIDNEIVAALDPETQVALAWFGSYGFDAKPSGDLIGMATAKNTAISALFASGVFKDLKGKAALTPREELPASWSPAGDRSLTVWECVQHTARVLNAEDGGAQAAARLIVDMGPKAAEARTLLDRLFRIATEKGWASEALVYNQLAEEWPHLTERAAKLDAAPVETGDLFAQA